MTTRQHGLRVGLVDFANPAFLLIGEASSFNWLAEQIESRHAVGLECERGKAVARLSIIPAEHEGRLTLAGAILEWLMSATEAALVSQQLRGLASSSSPAHAYLDPASNLTDVQIIASKGEYDAARVFAE